jgi:outer membrane protein assembly factor BamB
MRNRRWVPALAAAACLIVAGATAGCGGGNEGDTAVSVPPDAPGEAGDFAEEWPAPNYDYANTRDVQGSEITSGNADDLQVAWTLPITAKGLFGGFSSTPIIAGDVAYLQDLSSNVTAVDVRTGKVEWTKKYDMPDIGPNGLTIGYGKIFGATPEFAFALDAETGDEVWRSKKLVRNSREGIDMAPAVYDETVYVSTVPGNANGFYEGNGVGVLWALDAETGDAKWSFDTVPTDLWDPQHKDINSGGGLWHPPAFDDNGDMYIDVANPGPWPGTEEFPWGSSRPGPNPYTNTMLKLDHLDGSKIWDRQVLPHDVYDWDLQLPPILTESGGTSLVLAAGKLGYVFAIDRNSGDVVWKTAVGVHNGHDQDNQAALAGRLEEMPKLPVTVFPGTLGGVETQMAVADGVVYAPIVDLPTTFKTQVDNETDFTGGKGEMVALDLDDGKILWTTKFPAPAYGAATVANDLVFTTTFDGAIVAMDKASGEVAWREPLKTGTNAPIAISGDTLLTAASFPQGGGSQPEIVAYRLGTVAAKPAPSGGGATTSTTTTSTTAPTGGGGGGGGGGGAAGGGGGAPAASGEMVFSQNCATCHTLAAANATGTVGPNLDQLHPPESVVQNQVINGGGGMPAFGTTLSSAEIKAVAAYVAQEANPNAKPSGGGGGGGP